MKMVEVLPSDLAHTDGDGHKLTREEELLETKMRAVMMMTKGLTGERDLNLRIEEVPIL